jgi:thioredoxin reductase (NADPH)
MTADTPVANPVLVVVDEDRDLLATTEQALSDRYERDYRVEAFRSATAALDRLEHLAGTQQHVALVLSAQWLTGTTGDELLKVVHRLHPHAKRALTIAWRELGDVPTGRAVSAAIATGRIDHYVIRPFRPPDESFHHAISSFLLEWSEAMQVAPHTIHVTGESWSGRAYELSEVLGRCAIPHTFALADSTAGRAALAAAGDSAQLPIVSFPDGTMLSNPTNVELAAASRAAVTPKYRQFDVVIAGAGPAGLSAAVYGASEGLRTLVVDQGGIGGQAASSSSIRNYLGFPRGVSGRRLAQQAYEQAWILGAQFAFMQQVADLGRDDDGLFVNLTDSGVVRARAVILATGVRYRRLAIPELDALNGAGVYYGGPASEAAAMTGREVFVVGGANSAGQAALHLASYARRVTVVVRATSLDVGMSAYLVRQLQAASNIDVVLRTEVVGGGGDGVLEHLVLRDSARQADETVPADGMFVMIGAQPHTDWLPATVRRDANGFVLTGAAATDHRTLGRPPRTLETSMQGVFAVGDVRHGSVKRVASAVGEGSTAIQHLHHHFSADATTPTRRPNLAGPNARSDRNGRSGTGSTVIEIVRSPAPAARSSHPSPAEISVRLA